MHAVTTPIARNSDPFTSHEAAEVLTMTGVRAAQQRLAALAVKQYPGLTSLELSQRARMDRYMLARRLPECEEAKEVRRGQVKKCSVSGRSAVTWYPPEVAEQLSLQMTVAA
jgi:hypothetical protein